MQSWKPIETAPPCQIILGISGAGTYKIGTAFSTRSDRVIDALIDSKSGKWLGCDFWQPLPEPPAAHNTLDADVTPHDLGAYARHRGAGLNTNPYKPEYAKERVAWASGWKEQDQMEGHNNK